MNTRWFRTIDTSTRRRIVLCLIVGFLLVICLAKFKKLVDETSNMDGYSWSMTSPMTSNKNERSLALFPLFNSFMGDEEKESSRMILDEPFRKDCTSPFNSPIGAGYEFLMRQPISLPDDYSRSLKEILVQDWVCDLQMFLKDVDEEKHIVNMIAANSNFTDPLLNWLISSLMRIDKPMVDVIVISLDEVLHNLLISRGIPSLLVTPDMVMRTEDFPDVYHMHNGFYQARMMVMRLINHWGYDAANYDTDAIFLRNPQSIYDAPENADVDIFAGFAISFPPLLHRKWGATLCNGAWLVRSNPRTEIFWENVGLTPNAGCERGMDQCKVNYAFERMGLNWTVVGGTVKEYDMETEWYATGDVKVYILSLRTICRQRFCMEEALDQYHIWHKGSCDKTADAKKESAEFGGLWWLRGDWRELTALYPDKMGYEWLQLITNFTNY